MTLLTDMEHLETDLRANNLSRKLRTHDSKGKAVPAFEFLAANQQMVKQLKLELKDITGSVVELSRPST